MPDMRSLPIGVFDSGLGGLTVVRELARTLPDERIVYLGDTARCPYGPRDTAEVRQFVLEIGAWLAAQPVKLIVIACNTATAAGLALAQQAFSVPVVGVVEPGARAAVMATQNRRVGVIGTIGTVRSGAYSAAVRALDAGVTVFSVATPAFVDLVEAGLHMDDGPFEDWLSTTADVFIRPSFYELARDYLDPLKREHIDTLVLGCTHFPLLSAAIQQVVGPHVRLISSAEETAREVAETLAARGQRVEAPAAGPRYQFVTTGDAAEFARQGSRVLGFEARDVRDIDVEALTGLVTPDLRAVLARFIEEESSCA